ncbi:hypothetical protein, partial [Hymenobacter sp. UYP22]|uniref:hypothetical protein n=1 Tax=Hymenobacter sp. UYP22 TaxID=3156348 RepID=UPI003398D7F5
MKYIPYQTLIDSNYVGKLLTYSQLLSTVEWQNKRREIIARDYRKCRICEKEETINSYEYELQSFIYFWTSVEYAFPHIDGIYEKLIYSNKPYILHVHHT